MDRMKMFQFPSNGNADTKKKNAKMFVKGKFVSIPFKRERGYKGPARLDPRD